MAKINGTTWGVAPEEQKIKNDLIKFTGMNVTKIKILHIRSGFTDNVFLIETETASFILKEFTEDWHLREVSIYIEVLSRDANLKSPQFLYLSDNRMYLEYLSPDTYKPFDKLYATSLYEWIIYKFNNYLNKPIEHLIEQDCIKKHYLLDKPLKKISEIYSEKMLFDREILKFILNNEGKLNAIFNKKPSFFTLEHGDLERQNLFWNIKLSQLAVIDWTNAKFADGLTDINQFLENCDTWGLNKQNYYEKFSKDISIPEFDFFIKRNRLFMSLNKMNYYISRFQNGFEKSESNGNSTFELSYKYLLTIRQLLNEL